MKTRSLMLLICLFATNINSVQVSAQEAEQQAPEVAATTTKARPNPPVKVANTEATVNLQTTVTGNQEQPRVLYILPWQSPLSGDIEFQTLSSQQDEVFGHLEREELRRNLEAEDALKKDNHKKE